MHFKNSQFPDKYDVKSFKRTTVLTSALHNVYQNKQNSVFVYRVPTLLLTKNPGLFQDPMKNFPGPFRSPQMFKYKEKKWQKGVKIHQHSTLYLSKQ